MRLDEKPLGREEEDEPEYAYDAADGREDVAADETARAKREAYTLTHRRC